MIRSSASLMAEDVTVRCVSAHCSVINMSIIWCAASLQCRGSPPRHWLARDLFFKWLKLYTDVTC